MNEEKTNNNSQITSPTESAVSTTQPDVVEIAENVIKKRKGTRQRKGYFYEREEEAFARYVNSTNQSERDQIFREYLYPAFTKMIESIIRRYGLFTPGEEFEETFCDTISYLVSKLDKFDPTRGYKVYSYCGTVCKNYLIHKRDQARKRTEKYPSYEDVFGSIGEATHKDNRQSVSQEEKTLQFNIGLIENYIENLQDMLVEENTSLTEDERKVGHALLELLLNWEEIFCRIESNKFTKTSFIFFLREYTRLTTAEIRRAMVKYRDLYFLIKEDMPL